MLNSEYQVRGGAKLNDHKRLIMLIKGRIQGYNPKQGETFTMSEVNTFLEEAPNTGLYTLFKACLVIGIYGGLRCMEIAALMIEDFEKAPDNSYWVTYGVSKQPVCGIKNKFNIPAAYSSHITKYMECISEASGRFFRGFVPSEKGALKHGIFKKQPMGKKYDCKNSI